MTDAEFAAFIRDDNTAKVLLAEIDYAYQLDPADGGLGLGTVFLADYPYNTVPVGSPLADGVRYRDSIESTPNFSQSIDTGTLGGRTSYSVGQLVLSNADGAMDVMLDRIFDGRECRFYLGAPDWDREDFRNVLTAMVQRVTAQGQDRISVELRDRGLLLNTDLVGDPVGGDGPNSGQSLPIVMGFCSNVEAVLIDSATLTYGIADREATPIEVYDAAFRLDADLPLISALGSEFTVDTAADTIFHPDLTPAIGDILVPFTTASMGLTSGGVYYVIAVNSTLAFQLGTSPTGSAVDLTGSFSPVETVVFSRYPSIDNLDNPTTITLAHAPYGRVTCDLTVPVGAGSPEGDSRASDLMHELAVVRGGVPEENFVGPLDSFVEGDDSCDFVLGLAVTSRRNMTDVIDDVAFSYNGFWGFDQFSNLVYGRIRPQALDAMTVALELTSDDVLDIGSIEVDQLPPTYKDARGLFQRSWTDQTDGFAGGVSLDRISYLKRGGLFYSNSGADTDQRYVTNPALYHRTMVASPDYVTLISNSTCVLAYAQFVTWLDDRRDQTLPYLEVLRLKTRLTAIGVRLGDVVLVTLDRYGLDDGVRFQIIGTDVDLTAETVTLALLRRRVPDYLGVIP